MKPPSDYRRLKRAQAAAVKRRYEFVRLQEFMRRAGLRLAEQETPDETTPKDRQP